MTERLDISFDMRWPRDLLARVDAWRARQTVPPSRAAAVRWLVEHGLRFEAWGHPDDGKWLTGEANRESAG